MSAEERLLALEQLVAAMQGEVISARIAAGQAEQRATDAETRVRILGYWESRRASTGLRTVGDSSSSRSWATLAQSTQDSNRR